MLQADDLILAAISLDPDILFLDLDDCDLDDLILYAAAKVPPDLFDLTPQEARGC